TCVTAKRVFRRGRGDKRHTMTSLWLDGRSQPAWSASTLEPDQGVDGVVVGAGITGLVTAALLARAGKSVLVLEARTVGAAATGNTTAKISLLQGTQLSRVIARHGTDVAKAYVAGNREGMEWVVQHCETHGVAVQREDAYTYAQSGKGVPSARAELKACEAVGLDAKWDDD